MANLLKLLNGGLDTAWKAFVRPPRYAYDIEDLGFKKFVIGEVEVTRTDFEVVNARKQKLCCSIFIPKAKGVECTKCVVYLHGNSGSRICGKHLIDLFLPKSIAVVLFDFAGSGNSEGGYVSLGWYEAQDLRCVLQAIPGQLPSIDQVILWGRSMGAVTTLLFLGSTG